MQLHFSRAGRFFFVADFSVVFFFLYGLLALCVLVQLGYVVYYIPALLRYKMASAGAKPPVSVMVCAHNEHENLVELLPQFFQQDYPQFEIIVINDRSEDETDFYLSSLQQLYANLKVVTIKSTPQQMSPKKYAITLGIRAANYEHLLFTDADCRPVSQNWIAGMASGFANKTDIVLGYSPYEKKKGLLNSLIRFETLLTGWQYLSAAIKGNAYMGVGRNLAYTKSVFFRQKGFASHIRKLSGDDDLFVNQASSNSVIKVVIIPESQTISKPKETWAAWWKQKRRHLSAGGSYKQADRRRLGLYILSTILFYILSLIICVLPLVTWWLGILFVVRSVTVLGFYYAASRKLHDRISFLLLPFLDLIYFIVFISLGISLLFSRKVRWK